MKMMGLLCCCLVVVACSDDGEAPTPDQGPAIDQGPKTDTTPPDAPADMGPMGDAVISDQKPSSDTLALQSEKEPNNGATTTEFNPIQLPVQITGAIGQPKDADLFGVTAKAGERWVVTVKSGGTLEPHLAIFDPGQKLPTAVNRGTGTVMAEYYVLEDATILIAVRDRRNLGTNPQNLGGPAFTYTLTALPLGRAAKSASVGGQQQSTLDPPGTVRVFAFTPAANDDLVLEVLAQDIDSRLSLFHPGQKKWLGTNEDPSSKDAKLQGVMPFAGAYHAIVENVADTVGSNLGFTLKIAKQP